MVSVPPSVVDWIRLTPASRQSVIAWQALTASASYLSATALQGLVINARPSYTPERWHGTLLVIVVILVCLVFNTFFSKGLPHVETAILSLHIVLFIIVLVTMVVMSPTKSSNAEVWTLFLSEGGYESKGLSFFVGLITPVFAFAGADGAVHLAEEIKNSSRVLPWAMIGDFPVSYASTTYTDLPPPRLRGNQRLNGPSNAHRHFILHWLNPRGS
jgi:choline transport protein